MQFITCERTIFKLLIHNPFSHFPDKEGHRGRCVNGLTHIKIHINQYHPVSPRLMKIHVNHFSYTQPQTNENLCKKILSSQPLTRTVSSPASIWNRLSAPYAGCTGNTSGSAHSGIESASIHLH